MLIVTDSQLGTLRSAIRTADEEQCGAAASRAYADAYSRITNAKSLPRGSIVLVLTAAEALALSTVADEGSMDIVDVCSGKSEQRAVYRAIDKLRAAIGPERFKAQSEKRTP
jgi:hypothetical protein